MIPQVVTLQKELLTIDTTNAPFIRDALMPGIDVQPLFLDPQNGVWVLRVLFAPGVTLPRHFHTGSVHLWTISGRWNYVEHPEQPQTAGCYLYEPGGSVHQLQTPADSTEPTSSGSSADVGSSNSTILGSRANARAIATRCCWPPESWSARA